MKSRDQILLEEAYETILENKLATHNPIKKNMDPEVLEKMFNLLQLKAEFYCNIQGWPKGEGSSEHIKPTTLQNILIEVPTRIKLIEERGYDWNRIFISAHKVMDPQDPNFAKISQLMDITNTITFINNSDHILVRAYDPYGTTKGKETKLQKPIAIPAMLNKGEELLKSIYIP